MKRRSFIQRSSAASLPFILNGMPLTAIGKNALSNLIDNDNDRILVLINLAGGNDGLSTLIPMDQYDNLQSARKKLLVPENSVLELIKDNALHPAMTGLKSVWDDGKLNIIQSVGYPNQNRSHFRSTDIWQTASDANEYESTGWLGRYFDNGHPGYPTGYPNGQHPDPFAITIGGIISETCQGEASTFSLALVDPEDPGSINVSEEGNSPDNCYGHELDFISGVIKQSNAYSSVIQNSNSKGTNMSTKYVDNDPLSDKLKIVSRLISGGLQTKVYIVQLGGFDLHSGLVGDSSMVGRQAELLTQLSDAICAFQEDLELMGLEKRVIGMTFSEFGRQIKENESNGSDHGTAAPLFVFGSCVNSDIIGNNPQIGQQIEDQAGVPMQYDFRSIYGTLLMDWFNISEDDVRNVLFDDFQKLPLIEGCEILSTFDTDDESLTIETYPNPFNGYLKIIVEATGERMRLSLFDTRGAEIKVITDKNLAMGSHEFIVETSNLSSGTYYVRYASGSSQRTMKVIRL